MTGNAACWPDSRAPWKKVSTRQVVGFNPVVPKDKARVRVQVSATHTREDLTFAIEAFTNVRDELGL